jgi:hypothetical protein
VAAYSQFLGYRVTVRYRVGEMLLSASGTFSADSGRSIFLEQHVEQRGSRKYFRWEIPYPYIHHIETAADTETVKPAKRQFLIDDAVRRTPAAAAGESVGVPHPLPFPPGPKAS